MEEEAETSAVVNTLSVPYHERERKKESERERERERERKREKSTWRRRRRQPPRCLCTHLSYSPPFAPPLSSLT
jgi:hypothetical protein